MRKSRFTGVQIIGMIKEQEAGLPATELCRKHGIRWLAGECEAIADKQPGQFLQAEGRIWRHGSVGCPPPKSLEDENGKLTGLLADTMLDNVVLKDLLGKR